MHRQPTGVVRRQTRLALALAAVSLAGLVPAASAAQPVLRAIVVGSVPDHVAGVEVARRLPGLRMAVVDGTASELAALRRSPGVLSVSPDAIVRTTGSGAGSTGYGVLAPKAVGGSAGGSSSGRGVTVAVVDTGISDTAQLNRASGRLIDGANTSGEAGTEDGFGHGTFMANLIAGRSSNDLPTLGVAPAAKVVSVKVAGASGTTSLSQVLDGLDWVYRQGPAQGVRILSLSLAADRPSDIEGHDPLTRAVSDLHDIGITVLASTGNDAGKLGSPALFPGIIAVGAADTRDAKTVLAPFSGRGTVAGVERPDLLAPGVSVISLLPRDSALAKANPSAAIGYGAFRGSGTSQATAVAAGVAANLLSQSPRLTPDDVRASMMAAADDVASSGDGAGLVRSVTTVVLAPTASGSGSTGTTTTGTPTTTAGSWSAGSWSAGSWSAGSWSAGSWSSGSWSASSWAASSWASAGWN